MLKRQNSLAFFIAYVQSLCKNITAPSVKTLFFSNKRCDEVLHTNLQVQQPRRLHLLQKQEQVMTLWFYKQNQKSNITTGQKSVVNRRHLRPTGQQFLCPAQGTVQPCLGSCEEPARSQSAAWAVCMCLKSFERHFLVCHGLGE